MERIDVDAVLAIDNPLARYEAALDAFLAKRTETAAFVKARMEALGLQIVGTARDIGVDPSSLSRALKGNFTIPALGIVSLCYDFFHMSCHELLFGEKKATRLPMDISVMVEALIQMPENEKTKVYDFMKALYHEEAAAGRLIARAPVGEITKSRIIETAEMMHCMPIDICGSDAPLKLKLLITHCADEKNIGPKAYSGNLETLMYYALSCDTSLDYFMAMDYPRCTELKLYDKDVTVGNKEDREFVSLYLALPDDAKCKVFTKTLQPRFR